MQSTWPPAAARIRAVSVSTSPLSATGRRRGPRRRSRSARTAALRPAATIRAAPIARATATAAVPKVPVPPPIGTVSPGRIPAAPFRARSRCRGPDGAVDVNPVTGNHPRGIRSGGRHPAGTARAADCGQLQRVPSAAGRAKAGASGCIYPWADGRRLTTSRCSRTTRRGSGSAF